MFCGSEEQNRVLRQIQIEVENKDNICKSYDDYDDDDDDDDDKKLF
jgi:hypothetical protein